MEPKLVVPLLVVLVAVRHVVLTYFPWIVFSGYVFMFAIGYGVARLAGGQHVVALLVALLITYGRMFYRYHAPKRVLRDTTGAGNTAMFVAGLAAAVGIARAAAPFAGGAPIRYAVYLLLLYLTASTLEWLIHKYVMHCYAYWPWLEGASAAKWRGLEFLQQACVRHKTHHLSVKDDMTLRAVEEDGELVFHWSTALKMAVLVFVASVALSAALGLRISIVFQAVASLTLCAAGTFVWNNIHVTMHSQTGVHVDIADGPPNLNLAVSKDSLHHRNHEAHHRIKGDAKGNYNVVFLGADELLSTNHVE